MVYKDKLQGENMGMQIKNIMTWGLVIFLLIITIAFVSSIIIDQGVLDALKSNEWVTVSVILNDLGNKSLNTQLRSEILSNFTEKEFELKWESSSGRGFQGNITLEGLNKLSNNPNVLRVYLPIEGSTTENDSMGTIPPGENETIYTAEVDIDIVRLLETQEKVGVVVEFNHSLEKSRIEILKTEALSNLLDSEFLVKQNLENSYWFSGEITKKGLEKLILNKNVIKISKDSVGEIKLNNTKENNMRLIIIPILIILLIIILWAKFNKKNK